MLFTWDTTDLCIVFRGWHISGTGSLVFALFAIVLLTAGYEAVREISRRYEAYEKKVLEGRRGADDLRGECGYFINCCNRAHMLWKKVGYEGVVTKTMGCNGILCQRLLEQKLNPLC